MAKHVVAMLDELPPGSRRLVEAGGRAIVIFNVEGEVFGLLNRCPHQGGSLCRGTLSGLVRSPEPGTYHYARRGELIRCPWHGWQFDIRTGQSWCEPDRLRTPTYPVSVEAGSELVEGPYVAETVPVTVEGRYVVVTV